MISGVGMRTSSARPLAALLLFVVLLQSATHTEGALAEVAVRQGPILQLYVTKSRAKR